MGTTIGKIVNKSEFPVTYTGKNGGVPTGWSAWAFAPAPAPDYVGFNWEVTSNKKDQAILTSKGATWIWDDGNWNIRAQAAGQGEVILIHVNEPAPIHITIIVDAAGNLTATQP